MTESLDLRPYMNRLKNAQKDTNKDRADHEADCVLCDLLNYLGYKRLVKEYYDVKKNLEVNNETT